MHIKDSSSISHNYRWYSTLLSTSPIRTIPKTSSSPSLPLTLSSMLSSIQSIHSKIYSMPILLPNSVCCLICRSQDSCQWTIPPRSLQRPPFETNLQPSSLIRHLLHYSKWPAKSSLAFMGSCCSSVPSKHPEGPITSLCKFDFNHNCWDKWYFPQCIPWSGSFPFAECTYWIQFEAFVQQIQIGVDSWVDKIRTESARIQMIE